MFLYKISIFSLHITSIITYIMHSSFGLVFLTILISNLSWSVLAGDYPLIGVVLLQSAPKSEAFGTVTINQQFEGD
jgi:hypothetical protein